MSSEKEEIMNKLISLYDNSGDISTDDSYVNTEYTDVLHDEDISEEDIDYFNNIINKREEDIDLIQSSQSSGESDDDDNILSELRNIKNYQNLNTDNEDDLDQIIAEQYFNSKQSRLYAPPSGAVLISETSEDPDNYVSLDNNDVLAKAVMIVFSIIFSVLLIVIAGFFIIKNNNIQDTSDNSERIQSMEQALENRNSSVDKSQENTNSVAQGNISNINSTVEYKIEANKDINLAAVSYIENNGEEKVENFSTFPWNKTVNLSSNIVPQLGVSTSGNGDVVCTIIKDGTEMVTKTSSGDDPTVIC